MFPHRVTAYNSEATTVAFGQEINAATFALCKANLLLAGMDAENVALGNTLTRDAFPNHRFDYLVANPPFGLSWSSMRDEIEREHHRSLDRGRFGPGLPRVSDGQMLFTSHRISKMRQPEIGGSRIGIITSGSTLYTGGAGPGESNIRRFLVENDLIEAIVGLPPDLMLTTSIPTYVWILNNSKPPERRGLVQLVNAVGTLAPKTRGEARKELSAGEIAQVVSLYSNCGEGPNSKFLRGDAFGYQLITIERPLRLNFQTTRGRLDRLKGDSSLWADLDLDQLKTILISLGPTCYKNRDSFIQDVTATLNPAGIGLNSRQMAALCATVSEKDESANVCTDAKGRMEADRDLRVTESVPLREDVGAYFTRNIQPIIRDAWVDDKRTIVGYSIPFASYFLKPKQTRPLKELDAELTTAFRRIASMIEEFPL